MPHKDNFDSHKTHSLNFVSFLLGAVEASLIYVLSTYFAEVAGNDNVGGFYLVAYGLGFASLFFLRPIVRTFGKIRSLSIALVAGIALSAILSRLPVSWTGAALLMLLILLFNVLWVTIDIILESYSADEVSGRVRGLHLTIMNVGILLGPTISTVTLDRYGFGAIFSILVFGLSVILAYILIFLQGESRTVSGVSLRPIETIRKMWRERDLFRIYHVSFSMEFFYALMTVYTPIYLRGLGFAWNEIGIMFTIMLVPFVVLQYPLGILADRKYGEKEFLFASLLIAALATLALAFLGGGTMFAWAAMLFATRIGIAGIEVLRDSYFYKQIDGDDMDIIAFFRTSRPLANIVAACVMMLVLLVLPIVSVFFIVALMLSTALLSVAYLKDSR